LFCAADRIIRSHRRSAKSLAGLHGLDWQLASTPPDGTQYSAAGAIGW
jgi:hypothetical protein